MKAIETTFTYTVIYNHPGLFGGEGAPVTGRGSYLGKKPASVRTLREFTRENAKACRLGVRILRLDITGSSVSPWLYVPRHGDRE